MTFALQSIQTINIKSFAQLNSELSSKGRKTLYPRLVKLFTSQFTIIIVDLILRVRPLM